MASMSVSEEDLSCPVCCDIFKDPVVLSCSHTICKGCLQNFWKSKGSRECPVCRTISSNAEPPLNLLLKNLCETFSKGRRQRENREPLCSLHHSELKLFCKTEKQLICLVCRDSKHHKNHNFSPINEAAEEHKEELKVKLQPLKIELENIKKAKRLCDETAQYITLQAEYADRQIKEEFEKLHQFLRDEEAARIAALRQEKEQKSQMVKEKIEKMSREISSLSDTIKAIEEQMRAEDVSFLQNIRSTVKRAQCSLQYPEKVTEKLNLAKYLGNLGVLEKIRKIFQYTAVTLNPNTAHPCLTVSEDLSSVTYTYEEQDVPSNPERYDQWGNVLSYEGFNSGTHYWAVDVGNSRCWDVGVVTESAKRKGIITDWSGVWYFLYRNNVYTIVSSLQRRYSINVTQRPQKVLVKLDWDRGKVSIYDLDNSTHLHTFTATFTERVFPFFGTQCTRVPLKILPLKDSGMCFP